MRYLLPYPWLTLGLLAFWLLLNQSLSSGQILLGLLLSLLFPLVLTRLEVPRLVLRRPWAVVRLAAGFSADIVRSNIHVTGVILSPRLKQTSGFVRIPLEIRSPYALALLAFIITATPGTAWSSYNPASGSLVIHVLDLADDDDWADIIKSRYERLLKEIFE